MKFVGICLITNDVPGLTRFYQKVLGVEAEGDDIHAALKTKGAEITIYSVDGMENLAPGSMAEAGKGGFTIGFEVEDVDIEYKRLKKLGVEIVKLPKTYSWGTRSVWFRDPDSNIVNFFSNVKV